MTADSPVLTVPEVAAALRVSNWTIYERIRRDEIPVVRVGSRLRVPRVWLDKLLAGATTEAVAS